MVSSGQISSPAAAGVVARRRRVGHLSEAVPAAALAVVIFVAWVVAALLLPHTPQNPDPQNPVYSNGGTLAPLLRWDGYWYATITGHGYARVGGRYQPYAFFPLLPGIAALLHHLLAFISVPTAGIIVNAAAIVGAATLIDRILAAWPRRRRLAAVAVILTLPSAFFYATFYSEALFLLASALTVWALADERRQAWIPVGILLATLDRPPGALLLVLVLAAVWRRGDRWRRLLPAVAAAAVALGAVMLLDAVVAGDPFAFVHAQAGWTSLRTLGLEDGLRWVLAQSRPSAIWHSVITFGYWDLYLSAAGLWILRRRLGAVAPYAAAAMLICFVAGGVGTQSRYLVTLLPFWLGLLKLLGDRSARTWMLTTGIAIAGGIAVNLWMIDQFVRGFWAG